MTTTSSCVSSISSKVSLVVEPHPHPIVTQVPDSISGCGGLGHIYLQTQMYSPLTTSSFGRSFCVPLPCGFDALAIGIKIDIMNTAISRVAVVFSLNLLISSPFHLARFLPLGVPRFRAPHAHLHALWPTRSFTSGYHEGFLVQFNIYL